MVLKKELKTAVMEQYAQKQGDTGSPEVQIALITKKIELLVSHLKNNKKDNHGRHGLLLLVSQRKKLLKYLQSENLARYQTLTASLGIR